MPLSGTNLKIVQRKCGAYFSGEQDQTDHDEQLAIQTTGHDKSCGSGERKMNKFV